MNRLQEFVVAFMLLPGFLLWALIIEQDFKKVLREVLNHEEKP